MTAALHLTTDRLTLRQVQAGDLVPFQAYCASDRTTFTGGKADPVRAFEKMATMAGHWALRGFGRYVIDLEGQGIGHAGPLQLDDNGLPELTWTLWDESFEGHGYATEAVARILTHLRDDLRWHEAVAYVHRDNDASQAVASRLNGLPDPYATPPAWLPDSVTYRFFRGAL